MKPSKRYEIYGTFFWLKNCRLRRCSSLTQAEIELKALKTNANYLDLRLVEA